MKLRLTFLPIVNGELAHEILYEVTYILALLFRHLEAGLTFILERRAIGDVAEQICEPEVEPVGFWVADSKVGNFIDAGFPS